MADNKVVKEEPKLETFEEQMDFLAADEGCGCTPGLGADYC